MTGRTLKEDRGKTGRGRGRGHSEGGELVNEQGKLSRKERTNLCSKEPLGSRKPGLMPHANIAYFCFLISKIKKKYFRCLGRETITYKGRKK